MPDRENVTRQAVPMIGHVCDLLSISGNEHPVASLEALPLYQWSATRIGHTVTVMEALYGCQLVEILCLLSRARLRLLRNPPHPLFIEKRR